MRALGGQGPIRLNRIGITADRLRQTLQRTIIKIHFNSSFNFASRSINKSCVPLITCEHSSKAAVSRVEGITTQARSDCEFKITLLNKKNKK